MEIERLRQEYIMSRPMQSFYSQPQPEVCMTQPSPLKGNVDKEEKLQNLIAYYYNRK